MARTKLSAQEKLQIRNSLLATRERRKQQSIKAIELKINCHQTSKDTFNKIDLYLKQAKWITNDMLANISSIKEYTYKEHRNITRRDRNKQEIKDVITMPSWLHRGVVQQVKTNIENLRKAADKGLNVGKPRFKSEVKMIHIITGGLKIKGKSHVAIPGFPSLKVYGLEQLKKYPLFELADSRLVKRPSGYYILMNICRPKDIVVKENRPLKEVGLDFGIKNKITTSDGEIFDCNVQETEQLKFLQRCLVNKQKGSKRYYNLLKKIKREYEHIVNKRRDAANKVVAYLTHNYDRIYFQDEQLSSWIMHRKDSKAQNTTLEHNTNSKILSSYLGRIKSKLSSKDVCFKVSKWAPTTKFCPNCGNTNSLALEERLYKCSCGYSCDRDIHAAKNIKLFGSTKRAECLEQTSAIST